MRQRVVGTVERPRLHVNCTLRYIYAQVIDDSEGKVLASATSAGKNYTAEGSRSNIAAAKEVGKMVAEAAKAKNITSTAPGSSITAKSKLWLTPPAKPVCNFKSIYEEYFKWQDSEKRSPRTRSK